MEGATIHWFNLLRETGRFELGKAKRGFEHRYRGRKSYNSFEELKYLMQTRSVEEYMNEFEFIPSQVALLPKDCNPILGYTFARLTQSTGFKPCA